MLWQKILILQFDFVLLEFYLYVFCIYFPKLWGKKGTWALGTRLHTSNFDWFTWLSASFAIAKIDRFLWLWAFYCFRHSVKTALRAQKANSNYFCYGRENDSFYLLHNSLFSMVFKSHLTTTAQRLTVITVARIERGQCHNGSRGHLRVL